MIYSMTAFAHRAAQHPWGTVVWEIRSVNHRYLEMSLRLPDTLRELENAVRERLRQALGRGKVECQLKYQPITGVEAPFLVNKELVRRLAEAEDQVRTIFQRCTAPSTVDVLAWPGVLQLGEMDMQIIHVAVLDLFDQALKDLLLARQQEGKALLHFIEERLAKMNAQMAKVRQRLPSVMAEQRQKMKSRFEEVKLELDTERLEQELVLVAQKIDIAEELERLDIHLQEVHRTLQEGGAVGRRLDFLMQELNREANTLAAKAVDSETSLVAVELKVLIEQMREQVQNIE